jgi:hypothetical protein
MATPTLEGCREKWARGTALMNKVIERVDEYAQADPPPHRSRGVFDASRGSYVITGELVRPPDDTLIWSVYLGDAVHNLRSALDHLVWQLVLLDSKKNGTTENAFPISPSGHAYWGKRKDDDRACLRDRYLKGISDEHKAIIDAYRPYRTRDQQLSNDVIDPLKALADMDNQDKHQLLHVLIFAVDNKHNDEFRLIPNADAGQQRAVTFKPFPEHGIDEIMVVEFECPGPKPSVDSQGDLTISPGIDATRMRLTDLPEVSDLVLSIIERFAPDFP